MKPLYVTTPIYYVNDMPHLGTAYTTIAADILARYGRLTGRPTWFLTGTDEHGEKIQTAAQAKSMDPQSFVDEVSLNFRNAWKKLAISNDDFIRTTEERHKKVAQDLIKKAIAKGDIYLGNYSGWYCVSDETFWTETQLQNGKCPSCSRDVKKVEEENYFFKLSNYTDKLLEHIENNPGFILPVTKKNEVVAFLKEGVRDISISRTSFSWGIPFPETPTFKPQQKHIMYVWFDALPNYVSAVSDNPEKFKTFWGEGPIGNAIHLIGKDILRFHAVYWPCFLMSVGLPLPKSIFAHGWWTVEGQKMSKSLGNTIAPVEFAEKWGLDALRLFMFREFPMGQDGDFSLAHFKDRSNADLANNLGNLVSRTLNLVEKNLGGEIHPPQGTDADLAPVTDAIQATLSYLGTVDETQLLPMERLEYHEVLNRTFEILIQLNKYINLKTPWYLAKDPTKTDDLKMVLYNVCEVLRIATHMLWPFIPTTCEEILRRLGQDLKLDLVHASKWGSGKKGKVTLGTPLFPRLA